MNTLNLLITKSHAAVAVGICPDGSASPCTKSYDWGSYIGAFLTFAQRVATVIVILSIIWAGYIYLTSQGDSAKLNSAKDRVLGALLGYLILILMKTILNYIGIKSP